MKAALFLTVFFFSFSVCAFSQITDKNIFFQQAGNAVFDNANNNASSKQRSGLETPSGNVSIDATTVMIEAGVLMNVKAEVFVTTFGVSQECDSTLECNDKIDARIAGFIDALKSLGIAGDQIFVDFITNNKIYDFEVSKTAAKEKPVGFEVSKNVMIYYKDKDLTDRIVTAAARFGIYDLVKVDYLVPDAAGIKNKLLEEALRIVKEKEAKYSKAFGFKYRAQVLIEREKYNTFFPTQMYSSYSAYETGSIIASGLSVGKYGIVNAKGGEPFRVQQARKGVTFYYDPLNADGFDHIINPIVNEPVVQFTLFVRIRYELDR